MLSVLWFLLWTLLCGQARGSVDSAIEVRPTGTALHAAEPGTVLSLGFQVEARGPGRRELVERLDLPEGWTAVIPPTRFAADPGSPRLRMVAVLVGPAATAGTWPVRYTVTDVADPAATDSEALQVVVARQARLRLEVLDAPPFVIAGESATARVRVANGGNTPLRAAVRAVPESGLRASLDGAAVQLEPGEAGELLLTVHTEAHEERSTQRVVRLEATAEDARAEAVLVVPVTRRAAADRRWRTLPVTLSLAATTDGEAWAVQPELAGKGELDADGDWRTDFLLRGPDAEGTGAYAERDELRALLQGPWLDARLGDQVYALSPLLDPGRYGRGAGLLVHEGPVRVGAHVVQERYTTTPEARVGATAGATLDKGGTWALNLLHRLDDPSRSVLGVSGDTTVPDLFTSSVELATNLDRDGEQPWGLRAEAASLLDSGLALRAREIYATPDFAGYERDVHRTQAAAVVPVAERWRLQADLQREARNLTRDPTQAEAPLLHRAEARVGWSAASLWSLEGGLAGATEHDRLDDESWREGAARLSVALGRRQVYGSVQAVGGVHDSEAQAAADGLGGQLGATLSVLPWPTLALRGHARIGTVGAEEPTSLFAVDSSLGAGLVWQTAGGELLELDARRSLAAQPAIDQLDARGRITGWGGLALDTRWSLRTGADRDVSGLVELSLPLGVPIGRDRGQGGVQGRLYDAADPDHRGISGAVLRVGDVVVITGRDGRFVVGRLKPGRYVVDIDRNTVGPDRVADLDLPMEIEVAGGPYTELEIGLSPAARVRGRVVQVGHAAQVAAPGASVLGDASDRAERPLAGARVVLTAREGGELLQVSRHTDRDGRFDARGLRPGRWTIVLAAGDVPVSYEVRDAGHAVEVAGGEAGEVELVVQPRARRIRYVESPPAVARVGAPRPSGADAASVRRQPAAKDDREPGGSTRAGAASARQGPAAAPPAGDARTSTPSAEPTSLPATGTADPVADTADPPAETGTADPPTESGTADPPAETGTADPPTETGTADPPAAPSALRTLPSGTTSALRTLPPGAAGASSLPPASASLRTLPPAATARASIPAAPPPAPADARTAAPPADATALRTLPPLTTSAARTLPPPASLATSLPPATPAVRTLPPPASLAASPPPAASHAASPATASPATAAPATASPSATPATTAPATAAPATARAPARPPTRGPASAAIASLAPPAAAPPSDRSGSPAAPAAAAPAPPVGPWARARYRGSATISPEGLFLGGELAYEVIDAQGRQACAVRGEWRDDGADLPLVDCPDCAWVARLEVHDVQVEGAGCFELEGREAQWGAAAFGWTPRWSRWSGVLLRWDGQSWRPVAAGVDPSIVELLRPAELP